MVEEAKEIENSESPAVRLMRLSYIERIGTLLGIMIGEDISPRKSIVNEFHVSYDTIRNFLNFDSKIKIETILKFCLFYFPLSPARKLILIFGRCRYSSQTQ